MEVVEALELCQQVNDWVKEIKFGKPTCEDLAQCVESLQGSNEALKAAFLAYVQTLDRVSREQLKAARKETRQARKAAKKLQDKLEEMDHMVSTFIDPLDPHPPKQ